MEALCELGNLCSLFLDAVVAAECLVGEFVNAGGSREAELSEGVCEVPHGGLVPPRVVGGGGCRLGGELEVGLEEVCERVQGVAACVGEAERRRGRRVVGGRGTGTGRRARDEDEGAQVKQVRGQRLCRGRHGPRASCLRRNDGASDDDGREAREREKLPPDSVDWARSPPSLAINAIRQ